MEALMLRIGLAFLAGNALIQVLPSVPAMLPWGVPVLILILTVLLMALVLRSPVGVALAAGILWTWCAVTIRLGNDLPAALELVDLDIVGRVDSLPDSGSAYPQFEFAVTQAPSGVPERVRLSWYETDARPQPGETWRLTVRLKRRSGFANPGGFDYEAQLLRQQIGATGYVRENARNARLAAASGAPLLRVRAWLAQRLALAVGDDPALGILQGLAVGETGAMSPQQWRVLAATGTTHLMAISGLHISMVAALVAWLGGNLVLWPSSQRWRLTAIHGQVIFGLLGAIGYSMLAGLSVPTQRTLAMLCIAFMVRARHRVFSIGNALGLALFAVLLIDPFAPLAPGAWLSFGAVAAILLAASGMRGRDGIIRSFTRTQLAVTVGLLPILLAVFGSVSLVSPVANAVAVPLFTLVLVPLVLVGTSLAAAWIPAGAPILKAAAGLLHLSWPLFEWFAALPAALWHFPELPWPFYAALSASAALLILPGVMATRLAAASVCLPILLWRPSTPGEGEFRLAQLDVGQGLASVVHTRTHTLVYDAGPAFRSGRDTGELVVIPYLYSQGARSIDVLMISHGDLDHSGGMHSILQSMPVARLLGGPSVAVDPAGILQRCRRGQSWTWDGVRFEVLHPSDAAYERDNDSSCVLSIVGAGGSALLTGDIQSEGETALAASGLRHADIVVAPHHGSRTSSSESLVATTAPSIVVFSAGYRNRWGFPKPEVIDRWCAHGATAVSTVDAGAIVIDVLRTGVAPPRLFRRDHPHYWRSR